MIFEPVVTEQRLTQINFAKQYKRNNIYKYSSDITIEGTTYLQNHKCSIEWE